MREPPAKPDAPARPAPSVEPAPPPATVEPVPPPPAVVAPPKPPAPPGAIPALLPAAWTDLPQWSDDDHAAALKTFLTSCEVLASRPGWSATCAEAARVRAGDRRAAQQFFRTAFRPWRATNADGSDEGLVTGYYEPLVRGSRKATARYRFPLYAVPEDLLVVDLSELHPELKGARVRGRLDGRRVVPYWSRAEIERGDAPLAGRTLVWVDDAIDLFFLQIQGSGQVQLDTGERLRVGYADQNGHPYRSIGRLLVERGEVALEQASMQGIKAWARQNPDRLPELLNQNPSYVFFRELPAGLSGPIGALGVPVAAGRSLAVDARYVPLGAPVFLATTWPNTTRALNRLMMAQDTGGAIRGGVRADFFWGFGDPAGAQAGRMRQSGRMWVLLPSALEPQAVLAR